VKKTKGFLSFYIMATLFSLPPDIRKNYLLQFLPFTSLYTLQRTCKEYYLLIRPASFWRKFLQERYSIEYTGDYPAIRSFLAPNPLPSNIHPNFIKLLAKLPISYLSILSSTGGTLTLKIIIDGNTTAHLRYRFLNYSEVKIFDNRKNRVNQSLFLRCRITRIFYHM